MRRRRGRLNEVAAQHDGRVPQEERKMQEHNTDLSGRVGQALAAEYEHVRHRIHGLVDGLSTDELWHRPFPYGNSIGHLLLHLTGNLSYYIGAQIAASGYIRDRPSEFADDSRRTKDDVVAAFDRAVDLVIATLRAQTPEDWSRPYEAVGAADVRDRLGMFVHCATHADHHAGQMIYLAKQLDLPRARP
jgi:uncharacterized damage-inducible protein DinB